jgi:hypothetical protein
METKILLNINADFKKSDILISTQGQFIVLKPPRWRRSWFWQFVRYVTRQKFSQPIPHHVVKLINQ